MGTGSFVEVSFKRYRDVNTQRLERFLASLGVDSRTIKKVKRGLTVVITVEWSDHNARAFSEFGHHSRILA